MRVSSVNVQPLYNPVTKQNKVKADKTNVSFGGNEEIPPCYVINVYPYIKNPAFQMESLLLKDGFSPENIKRWQVCKSVGRMLEINQKDKDDIAAMMRVYSLMKEKFVTDDVKELNEKFNDIARTGDSITGKNTPENFYMQTMFLEVLKYTNKYNEALIKALLEDDNFDNTHIHSAINFTNTPEKVESVRNVYEKAKEIGFAKNFSFALSVMMNEATPFNMSVIYKALNEQDFLSEDDKFVSAYLIGFLRDFVSLQSAYLADDTMTLETVKEIMDLRSQAFEEDDEESE